MSVKGVLDNLQNKRTSKAECALHSGELDVFERLPRKEREVVKTRLRASR